MTLPAWSPLITENVGLFMFAIYSENQSADPKPFLKIPNLNMRVGKSHWIFLGKIKFMENINFKIFKVFNKIGNIFYRRYIRQIRKEQGK